MTYALDNWYPHVLLRRAAGRWDNHRHFRYCRTLAPIILRRLSAVSDAPAECWRVQRAQRTVTGMVVIQARTDRSALVLKLPQWAAAISSLQRERGVQMALRAETRLGNWQTLVARPIDEGYIDQQFYVAEELLPGRPALDLVFNPATCGPMLEVAAATIGELHKRTAAPVVVDAALLRRWVDEPLLLIRRVTALRAQAARHDAAIERLKAELYRMLIGQTFRVGWIHGDFWPGNILVGADGVTPSGLVDWERAAPHELPLHDLLHLVLYTRKLLQRCEPGDVIKSLLQGAPWTPRERALLESMESPLFGDPAGERAMLLLYWLRFWAANLQQSPYFAENQPSIVKNIENILECV